MECGTGSYHPTLQPLLVAVELPPHGTAEAQADAELLGLQQGFMARLQDQSDGSLAVTSRRRWKKLDPMEHTMHKTAEALPFFSCNKSKSEEDRNIRLLPMPRTNLVVKTTSTAASSRVQEWLSQAEAADRLL